MVLLSVKESSFLWRFSLVFITFVTTFKTFIMYKELLNTFSATELKNLAILLREFKQTPRPTLSKLTIDVSEAIMNKLQTIANYEDK